MSQHRWNTISGILFTILGMFFLNFYTIFPDVKNTECTNVTTSNNNNNKSNEKAKTE